MENFTIHRGYVIKPKRDFGQHGYLIKGKVVREGFVVDRTTDGCLNVMPGATWFQTVQEAKDGIDDLIAADFDGQKFWRLNYQRRGIETAPTPPLTPHKDCDCMSCRPWTY